jgi:protein TonB
MGVYTQSSNGNWLSRRGTFLFLLIAFHVLLLWALKSGFAIKFYESLAPPIKVAVIDEVKEEEPPPPPPPVRPVELPPISVPPVLVDIQVPVEAPPITVTTAPPPPGPPAPVVYGPPAPPAPVTTAYAIAFKPDVSDYYPPTSIQLEETGRPRVKICWDNKGKVGEVTLAESSTKKRLDDAAIRMGKQYRFKPGTADGVPVGNCAVLPVVFTLK